MLGTKYELYFYCNSRMGIFGTVEYSASYSRSTQRNAYRYLRKMSVILAPIWQKLEYVN
jgi:hypothetical protein